MSKHERKTRDKKEAISNRVDRHETQVRAFLESFGIQTDDDGFQTSARTCVSCNTPLWVKVTQKPHSWESDVMRITFNYQCRVCNTNWYEYDSD